MTPGGGGLRVPRIAPANFSGDTHENASIGDEALREGIDQLALMSAASFGAV